jgi:hypothetical protein
MDRSDLRYIQEDAFAALLISAGQIDRTPLARSSSFTRFLAKYLAIVITARFCG